MFIRSIEKHKLWYTIFVGDGDSSLFGAVKEAVLEKYGQDYSPEKEDGIGHIQKRMGSALRTYKDKKRGVTLSDGKGVSGQDRLNDLMCDKFQFYYGYAIQNNKGDTEKIISAIWAIYYHSIWGPPPESLKDQHRFCPGDENIWCKYRHDIINGRSNYNSICLS